MSSPITFEWIAADDPRMEAVNELRHEALFAPFGIPRHDGWDDAGSDRHHLVALADGRVVGYSCLLLDTPASGHIRQVSVREDLRGGGIGAGLMAEVESHARALGLASVWLDARCTAEGFYHACGYETTSGVFPSGRTQLPHVRMNKPLL